MQLRKYFQVTFKVLPLSSEWKLSNLSQPVIQVGVSKFPMMDSVSGKDGKLIISAGIGDVRAGEGLQEDPALTCTHLIGARPLSQSRQKSGLSTTPLHYKCVSTTTMTSPDDLSPLRCGTTADDFIPLRQTASTANPLNLGHTLSTGHTVWQEHSSCRMAWYRPLDVTSTETRLAPLVSRTCQYPFNKSNLLTYLAWPILSIQSSDLGMSTSQSW